MGRSYHRRMMTTRSNILECLCFLFIVSIFSFSSHRVSSQDVSSMNETNNTSYNEIDLDQLEYLCQHYYPQEFIVSAEVLESGCRLECVLLKSSGDHGSNFFDASVTKVHNLNEGLSCDTELDTLKCVNGSCIEPPETGKVRILIMNGTVTRRDESSTKSSDPYVKLFLDQKYLMKTKTIENNNNPIWNQAIITPVITSDTQISLIVLNRDAMHEQILTTVQTNIDLMMAQERNGTITCAPPITEVNKNQLCYSLTWFPGF